MRKLPLKKRVLRSLRPLSNVDPARVAMAALERIKTVLVKSGRDDRLGAPLSMTELAAQAEFLGTELPPSYVAAMRVASKIGEPETFLLSYEMNVATHDIVSIGGEEAKRYAPFCRASERLICFDRGGDTNLAGPSPLRGELPIVEWQSGTATPAAAHFGEWLDAVADRREESVETAARMPASLKRLLYELGFRFEYPVVGRLETGDAEAVVDLIGSDRTAIVRGEVDRLFDSSGKASLTLNVDEFTLAVSLRTGIYVFEAEDVFRWLRTFRDENFYGDAVTVPSHPENVRDLRRAPREPPLVQRGVVHVASIPARTLVFRSASGVGPHDYYLLGRTASTSERAASVVLHVVGGVVTSSRSVEEPLNDLYAAEAGTVWGLTSTHAVRVTGEQIERFPLERPTAGRPWWYGIGGDGPRVLVWGASALLEFDGRRFVPFSPDAKLDESESVIALQAQGQKLSMLVCGDRVGAVARFDAGTWQPITENQVIDAALADLDVWRGVSYVLDRDRGVWRIDSNGPPRPLHLVGQHDAFITETSTMRPLYGICSYDGGMLLASTGGVISVGSGEPLFHAVPSGRDPFRLVRIGGRSVAEGHAGNAAVVALSGPNAWIWRGSRDRAEHDREQGFDVIDVREW